MRACVVISIFDCTWQSDHWSSITDARSLSPLGKILVIIHNMRRSKSRPWNKRRRLYRTRCLWVIGANAIKSCGDVYQELRDTILWDVHGLPYHEAGGEHISLSEQCWPLIKGWFERVIFSVTGKSFNLAHASRMHFLCMTDCVNCSRFVEMCDLGTYSISE